MKTGVISGDYGQVRIAAHKNKIYFCGTDIVALFDLKPFLYYERQIRPYQKIKAPYRNTQGKLTSDYVIMIDEEALFFIVNKSEAPNSSLIYQWVLEQGMAFLRRRPKIFRKGETSSEIFGNEVNEYYKLGCFDGDEFRRVNTMQSGGQTLYVAKDIIESLHFDKVTNALRDFCPTREACRIKIKDAAKQYTFTSDGDFMRAIVGAAKLSRRSSLRKKCKMIESWIYDKVMCGIMQDGGYIYNADKFVERKWPHLEEQEKERLKDLLIEVETRQIETPIEERKSLFDEELDEE